MIKVVNKRRHTPRHDDVYIGRPSVFGNPFTHKEGTLARTNVASRSEAVKFYHGWLREQYISNPLITKELQRLADLFKAGKHINLVCWCAPKECHGDVIKDAIEKIAGRQ